jgi:hypothetical protein
MTSLCPLENSGFVVTYALDIRVYSANHVPLNLADGRLCLILMSAPDFWHIEQYLCLQQDNKMRYGVVRDPIHACNTGVNSSNNVGRECA